RWQALNLNLPPVPVHDLAVKGDDLVIATHGRAFWSLDDISSLRQLTATVQNEPAHLFHPAVAFRARLGAGGFGGASPSEATIDYWLKSAPAGDLTLEILDAKGALVRRFTSRSVTRPEPASGPIGPGAPASLTKHLGMNRFGWDLRYRPDRGVPSAVYWQGSLAGPLVVPGTYQAKLIADGQTYTAPLVVKEDPRIDVTQADLEQQLALGLQIQQAVDQAHDAINQMNGVRAQLEGLARRLGSAHQDIAASAKELGDKVAVVENRLINNNSKAHEDGLNFPIMLANQMVALQNSLERADRAPTAADSAVYTQLKSQIDEQLAAWRELQSKDLAALNQLMKRANVPFVSVPPTPAPASM
ncbi:MAG TPA: hypothetical protein VGS20_01200, partial [Candidatus Acidoferrales bacterium]|nr:hypothetical protein [Candidatus Acidoferrales bacterium]